MFSEGAIDGVNLVSLGQHRDERGTVSRIFENRTLLPDDSIPADYVLSSNNPTKQTLRGFHYQEGTFAEAKLFRCVSGRIFDVVVDVREDSNTFLNYSAYELEHNTNLSLFVPAGCANAWMTLEDHTVVIYAISGSYSPGSERGLRFDDPSLPAVWPVKPIQVSEKDRSWPDFQVPRG